MKIRTKKKKMVVAAAIVAVSMAKKGEQKNGEVLKTFDMYHFFSRKDVIFVMAFVIAFLIFTLAVKLAPEII